MSASRPKRPALSRVGTCSVQIFGDRTVLLSIGAVSKRCLDGALRWARCLTVGQGGARRG